MLPPLPLGPPPPWKLNSFWRPHLREIRMSNRHDKTSCHRVMSICQYIYTIQIHYAVDNRYVNKLTNKQINYEIKLRVNIKCSIHSKSINIHYLLYDNSNYKLNTMHIG